MSAIAWSADRNCLLARRRAGVDSSSSRYAASGRPAIIGLTGVMKLLDRWLCPGFDGFEGSEPEPPPGGVGIGRPPGGGGRVGPGSVGTPGEGRPGVGIGTSPVGSGTVAVGSGTGSRLAEATPGKLTITRAATAAAVPETAQRREDPGIGAPTRNGAGLIGAPSTRTSKCRWGPVE